ncbi:hypothetical protein D9M72_520350 [compost metagenome]
MSAQSRHRRSAAVLRIAGYATCRRMLHDHADTGHRQSRDPLPRRSLRGAPKTRSQRRKLPPCQGRDPRHRRRKRLRQDKPPARHPSAPAGGKRADPARRPGLAGAAGQRVAPRTPEDRGRAAKPFPLVEPKIDDRRYPCRADPGARRPTRRGHAEEDRGPALRLRAAGRFSRPTRKRTLRWSGPARGDRPCTGAGAEPPHPRRTDIGARRLGAGADSQSPFGPEGKPRAVDALRNP